MEADLDLGLPLSVCCRVAGPLLGSTTMEHSLREDDAEQIRSAVRAFMAEMEQGDFDQACSYFSTASRAFVLAMAFATGLRTRSCGAALAHLLEKDTDVDTATLSLMWAQAREFSVAVQVTDADRATARLDVPQSQGSSVTPSARRVLDGLRLTKGLPMIKQQGEWKLGMRYVDDQPRG